MNPSSQPLLSVVIPVRNEEPYIAQTIRLIQEQDYPGDRLEILVVDGDSDDRTAVIVQDLAQRDPRIRLLPNPRRLSSAARNIGAREARGEIVLYIDGHVYIDNARLLASVARLMEEKDVSVLSRPGFQDTPGNTFVQNAIALARKSFFGHGVGSTGFTEDSGYCAPESTGTYYRTGVIAEAGYFDESFDAAEDYEFNYRLGKLGHRSYTAPELIVYYYPRTTLAGLFQQMKRYGIGRCRLVSKHGDAFSWTSLIPSAFVLGAPILFLASLLWPSVAPVTLGVLGLYVLLDVLVSLGIGFRHGLRYALVLPLVFPTIHIGLGWGMIQEATRLMFLGRRGSAREPA